MIAWWLSVIIVWLNWKVVGVVLEEATVAAAFGK